MHVMRMMLWRLASVFAVLLAVIGIALPGLPTVPFLILAAWCAGKGWPRLEQWLLTHPTFGPPIRQWRAHGVVPRKAKYIASVMIMISMCLLWLSAAPHLVAARSEEHTSELQSRPHLVCRLLLEKKKKKQQKLQVCPVHVIPL